jgi:hypothetical protein
MWDNVTVTKNKPVLCLIEIACPRYRQWRRLRASVSAKKSGRAENIRQRFNVSQEKIPSTLKKAI